MLELHRYPNNPVLKPNTHNSWEAEAAFHGCPFKLGRKIYLLYRAVSLPHYHTGAGTLMRVSDIGLAHSTDGINFTNRQRFIVPEKPWEIYGVEDPRVCQAENKYYIFYTALSTFPFTPQGIRVGVATTRDFVTVDTKKLVTPFNAKAMALFPEKIQGKWTAILTANTDLPPAKIGLATLPTIEHLYNQSFWNRWYKELDKNTLKLQRHDKDHVELGPPPLKTKHGWLVIYSYIRNYYSDQRLFGIEAALLDLKEPQKIIARTTTPLIVPKEIYERYGMVPNVIFPSGALIQKDVLWIYYSAADSVVAAATVKLQELLRFLMRGSQKSNIALSRPVKKPIIEPAASRPWEAKATFNPAAVYLNKKVHILYRAMGADNTSVIGYAKSKDGIKIDERWPEPIYTPRREFEQKKVPNGNSGCEDPRLTLIGQQLYMTYTAFDGKHPPRVALTSIPLKKFLAKQWDWVSPVLLSPPSFDDKDACIFPEKVRGQYLIFHRIGDDVDYAFVPSLQFDGATWIAEHRWLGPRRGFWDSKKIGIAAPPVKIKPGWLMLYHGVSEDDNCYRVGAVLLDSKDPLKILKRTDRPIFEPELDWEINGVVNKVVFPCGNVLINDKLYVYYGGGDKVTGVATCSIDKLLVALEH